MKFSTLAIVAFTSVAVAKPIPDGDDNVVPIRWNDVEAGAQAAQASASASASAADTAESSANLAIRHVPDMPGNPTFKSGAEEGHRGGSRLWGRDVKHEHEHEHVGNHEDEEYEVGQGSKSGAESGGFRGGSKLWGREAKHPQEGHHGHGGHGHGHGNAQDQNQGVGQGKGDKSGAESGGFHGGSHLWGRDFEAEDKKKKGGVNPDIVGANPFDDGGDHQNDPSWG